MSFAEQPEPLELVVAPDGSGVVAADELARLGLGPGMHLKVVPVSETEPVRPARRSVRGILAGTAAVPSWADFEQASQTAIADEGIAVSVASLVDLWYVTQTTGAVSPATLHAVGDLLADPTSALDLVPIGAEVAAAYQAIPLSVLRDPWDRFIMATAQTLGIPLVTADSAITASGLVEVIW